jgi:hypothetical protein
MAATLAFVLTGSALMPRQTTNPPGFVVAVASNAVQDYADAREVLEA